MSITEKLNVPVQAFIATSDSVYRKPKLGMWNYLEQHVIFHMNFGGTYIDPIIYIRKTMGSKLTGKKVFM